MYSAYFPCNPPKLFAYNNGLFIHINEQYSTAVDAGLFNHLPIKVRSDLFPVKAILCKDATHIHVQVLT